MHDLYNLKEMLCDELKDYGRKGEMTSGTLDVVDKLAHAIKNIDKVIEAYEEEEYSNEGGSNRGGSYRSNRGSYQGGGNMGGGSNRGSYARGRNARRDSRGRYSSEGYSRAAEDMIESLRDLMEQAPDEKTRREIERLMTRMEQQ